MDSQESDSDDSEALDSDDKLLSDSSSEEEDKKVVKQKAPAGQDVESSGESDSEDSVPAA